MLRWLGLKNLDLLNPAILPTCLDVVGLLLALSDSILLASTSHLLCCAEFETPWGRASFLTTLITASLQYALTFQAPNLIVLLFVALPLD